MQVIIMGFGLTGSMLANRLDGEGHDVSVIDDRRSGPGRLSKAFRGRVITGAGFSRAVLKQAGVDHAGAFVAVSGRDNTNIVAARTAREDFSVPFVVASIADPRRADIYREFGIPTISPSRWAVNEIHAMLFHRYLEPDLSFGSGETMLTRSRVPAYLVGRRVNEFNVEGEIKVVEITRGGHSLIPGTASVIERGDLVSFVVASASLNRLHGFLGGEVRK